MVKQYPVEKGEDLRLLAERIGQSKDVLPKEKTVMKNGVQVTQDVEKWNEGFLTGAALKGFKDKGESFKETSRALDMGGEGVALLGLGTPAAVALKAGLKLGKYHYEDKAAEYGKESKNSATDIVNAWQETQPNEDVTELEKGLTAGGNREI